MASALYQQLVGWVGIVLLAVLAGRVAQQRVYRRYPAFFTYITLVLLTSIAALLVASRAPAVYPTFYWITEFVALLLGLAVTLEVFHKAFAAFPGVRKLANLVIAVLAISAIVRLSLGGSSTHELMLTLVELERDLRVIQSLMLVAFAALVLYYAIPIGRNLMGIALGYGWFVATTVFNLTLRDSLGQRFQTAWSYLQPLEYCVCLAVWCVALWSLTQFTSMEGADGSPNDGYDAISRETELSFGRLRSGLFPGSSR